MRLVLVRERGGGQHPLGGWSGRPRPRGGASSAGWCGGWGSTPAGWRTPRGTPASTATLVLGAVQVAHIHPILLLMHLIRVVKSRNQEFLDFLHGVGHTQVCLGDGRDYLHKHVKVHGQVRVLGLSTLPQLLLLILVPHGSSAENRDLGPGVLLQALDGAALWSQDLPNKVEAWVLLDWDQHPLLHSHILVVEEVQVGLSFLLGLSLLDPF